MDMTRLGFSEMPDSKLSPCRLSDSSIISPSKYPPEQESSSHLNHTSEGASVTYSALSIFAFSLIVRTLVLRVLRRINFVHQARQQGSPALALGVCSVTQQLL